jgi:thioredoxin 1
MSIDATVDSFGELVATGNVLVDFWGPRCQPCLQLMPAVEGLERRYEPAITLVKVDATQNRRICRDLRVAGLPTYITYSAGREVERLTGNPTVDDVERAIQRLTGGEVWSSEASE